MRLAAILLATLSLLVAPVEAGTSPTLGQMVGQLMVVRMHGAEPSQEFLDRIRAGQIGGVVLYADNFHGSPAPLIQLLQSAATVGHQPKLLIAVDQEGGRVKRLPGAPSLAPPRMTSAATAEAQGVATANNLRRFGINVDFAPVLDVDHGGFIAPRAFGKTPAAVASRGAAFAHGLARGGILATAKHFPGLGYAKLNTDDSVATVRVSAAKLRSDWLPYQRAHVPLVMLSTAVYPALGTHIPAATSRHVVTDLRRLGFRGAIVTDALQTPAVNQFFTTGEAAVRAVQAGVDLVLTAGTTGSTYDTDVESSAYAALLAAAKNGRLDRSTLRDAYDHVLRLKAQIR